LGVWEPTFVAFGGLFFFVLDPLYLGGYNFFNSILFLTIFSASSVPIGGTQVLFGHKKTTKPSPWIQPTLSA
jgi:hypothetical protein